MKKERTVLEWLNMLPEEFEGNPLRKMAVENYDEKYYTAKKHLWDYTNDRHGWFLACSFEWNKTKEGRFYWQLIFDNINSGKIKLIEPTDTPEFVWTDELVVEFTSWSLKDAHTMQGRYADIEQFKASKQRKPVFVTDNGVGIFNNDEYFFVDERYNVLSGYCSRFSGGRKDYKYFSTRELAEAYVSEHKPRFSLYDIKKAYPESKESQLFNEFLNNITPC